MSNLRPHQQRVVTEKAELDDKIGKLDAFFDTETFRQLDAAERSRLFQQIAFMKCYTDVLRERIAAFT